MIGFARDATWRKWYLPEPLRVHLMHKILTYGNKTVILIDTNSLLGGSEEIREQQ